MKVKIYLTLLELLRIIGISMAVGAVVINIV